MSFPDEEVRRITESHTEIQEGLQRFAASPQVVAAAKRAAEIQEGLQRFAASPQVVAAAKRAAEIQEGLQRFAASPQVVAAAKRAAEIQEGLQRFAASPQVVAAAKRAAEIQEGLQRFAASPQVVAAAKRAAEIQEGLQRFAASPQVVAAAKRAAEIQEGLQRFAASPQVVAAAKRAAEIQEGLQRFAASPQVVAAAKRAAEIQEGLQRFAASPQVVAAAKRAAEAATSMQHWLREWDESERRFIELLAPRGWMISPTTSLTEVHELLALAETEGIEAVEEALLSALTPLRCREIVQGLYDRPSFAEWRDVLDQALAGHLEGRYALSVPVWLLTFDGIWLKEFGVENIFTRITKKRGSIVRRAFPDARTRLVDALILVMSTVAEHLTPGASPTSDGLRRHVVIHGLDPGYGTHKASGQGILMLEALHYHLEQDREPRH